MKQEAVSIASLSEQKYKFRQLMKQNFFCNCQVITSHTDIQQYNLDPIQI